MSINLCQRSIAYVVSL